MNEMVFLYLLIAILVFTIILSSSFRLYVFMPIYNSFRKTKGKKDLTVLNVSEIEKSLKYFSANKIGSIIIIDRDEDVDQYIADYTEVNSLVRTEIIQSFFQKTSPLHDGAIIIRDSKIVSASALITSVTERRDIPRNFGTRHRSALGISEKTDALIITTSEETGEIFFYKNGNYKNLEQDMVSMVLNNNWEV